MFKVYKQRFPLNVLEVGIEPLRLANSKMKIADNYKEGMMLFNYNITPAKGKNTMPVLEIEYGSQM